MKKHRNFVAKNMHKASKPTTYLTRKDKNKSRRSKKLELRKLLQEV